MRKNLLKLLMLAMIFATSLQNILAQEITISGTVTDTTGESLPGVNVVVKGTTNGTITDVDGNYTINNVPSDAILKYSFIGFKVQEIPVEGKSNINVVLDTESVGLDEVVAVGYGTVSRKNLTTAISKVNTDEVQKAASSNLTQVLLGRAAGLQATVASAQPGGQVNISIRGAGNPIYVVDGVMMPFNGLEAGPGGSMTVVPQSVNRSGLAGINPEDIESVEVLKDAAASIYGIEAANGVILITTKKGKEGKMNLTYNGSVSVSTNYDYLSMYDAPTYMERANVFSKEQYLYNNGMVPYGTTSFDNGWSAPYSTAEIGSATTTPWVDQILRNGKINNQNVSVNGGSKNLTYYVSGNYFDQEGNVENSGMTRYSLKSTVEAKLAPFIKLTSTINVNRNEYDNSTVGGTSNGRGSQAAGSLTNAMSYLPHLPIKDTDGNYTVFMNTPNAVSMLDIADQTITNGTYMNFAADITILKDMLYGKLLYGNNLENTKRSTYIPSTVYFDGSFKSRGNLGQQMRQNQTFEATLSFMKDFDDLLSMSAVVGVGKYKNNGDGMNVAYDGQHDAIANDNLGAITGNVLPGSYRYGDEKRSQFIRANFDFLDKYVLAATLRRDGTDKFFPNEKYSLFPSVSAAWKMSNETFLENTDWINLLKLRASYGQTGSDNLGSSMYGTYSPFYTHVFFNENTQEYIPFMQDGLDYPFVSWQKTTMKNIGIDLHLFSNRISGSFDVFQNDVTDMLTNANTAGLSMFPTEPINGGHIRRTGWDATINSTNIKNYDFTWNTSLTLSKYNSVWKERAENYDYNTYELKENAPTNARYFYEVGGIVNSDMSNMPESQPEAARIPGYPIIVDQNADGEITIDDIVMENEVPTIYWGLDNNFTYKNFDLSIFIYSQMGVNRYNYAYSWAYPGALSNQTSNTSIYADDVWNSQDNTNGTRPGIAYSLASVSLPGGAGISTDYQKATFVRVRNITLGYTFDKVSKYFSGVRVFADVQNPFVFTNFDGFDPEIKSGGDYKGGKAEYPQVRTYSVGLKVNFNYSK